VTKRILPILLTPLLMGAAPFSPQRDVPDYVATYVDKAGDGPSHSSTITHHNGWTRIDHVVEGRPATQYLGPGPVIVESWAGNLGAGLSVERGADTYRPPDWDETSVKTAEHDLLLGEPCDVWEIGRETGRRMLGKTPSRELSCVTPDGIELWKRFVSGVDGATASHQVTSLKRDPAASAAHPPPKLLDLNQWIAEGANAPQDASALSDVTVVMRGPGFGQPASGIVPMRTVRRHHPWSSVESEEGNGRRSYEIRNEKENLSIIAYTDLAGRPTSLVITKDTAHRTTPVKPVNTGRTETVLGETCTWFDMMPGVLDGGHEQCLTADGVPLREIIFGQGSQDDWTALEVRRAPMLATDAQPPAALLAPATWGFPEN